MATVATPAREREARDPEPSQPEPIPPLENGDRLTRPEFERRYDAMPQVNNAQLIEGIVYMGSPVNHVRHGRPHLRLGGCVDRYILSTRGVDGGDNSSIRLDLDNMPQPDVFLYIAPECGGQVRITEDGMIEAAPEFIAEVASSSASYDLNAKLNAYRRNGVREYVVWRTRDRAFDWFALQGGEFVRVEPHGDGLYRSQVMPGLWLDPSALIRNDGEALLRSWSEGIASPEHAAFVERLRAAQAPGT